MPLAKTGTQLTPIGTGLLYHGVPRFDRKRQCAFSLFQMRKNIKLLGLGPVIVPSGSGTREWDPDEQKSAWDSFAEVPMDSGVVELREVQR